MTSKPDADRRLLDAHDLALAALREITPASTIGPAAGYLVEEGGPVSLRFENRLPGYPGWYWTVTVARVDDEDPTVLEVELLPGDGALLAPEWVPWAERLAEYRAHQAELAEQAAAAAGDADAAADALAEIEDGAEDLDDLLDDSEDELDDLDELDDETEGDEPRTLHAGDLDGVDIDELDDSATDDDDESDEDDDESDEDEDDESDDETDDDETGSDSEEE
ncbi:DUF3027 domain-containing protein [Microbacterium hydrocarbonoxydans]|uniref:DUF3027 domain-containing protein n=1 Tax=Microbacterium hydrocarbonoxydans TaxID=273678 RepID=UPI0007BC4027|nr:DUF3027 domain-containing protein [Microbacterium hydrocarbonoxydans]GAT73978.1 hypothetical protein MHM582_2477 [Microbacterium sp. HM58-2]